MLIDFERNIVLFTPPKCGTMTLHEVLPQFGVKTVLGPQFDYGVGEHTTLLPFDVWNAIDRFRFVVATRNPYTRAASLYGHYQQYWEGADLLFPEFVEQIVVAPRHHFFNATISSVLQPLENPLDGRLSVRVDAFVRLEELAGDLCRLGYEFDDPLPPVHALQHRGLEEYTRSAQLAIETWARHDFDRFGYSRNLAQGHEACRDGLAAFDAG